MKSGKPEYFPGKSGIIWISLILVSFTVIFAGCITRKSVETKYYILEYPQDIMVNIADNLTPVPKSCLVLPVNVYPAFSTNQIAIRENSHEIRYFSFNQWAVRPEQSLTRILDDFLIRHNIYKNIYHPSLIHDADHIMETTVYNLEVISEGRDYYARLSVDYKLLESETRQIIYQHRADRKKKLAGRNLNYFAEETSKIFIEETGEFTRGFLSVLQ